MSDEKKAVSEPGMTEAGQTEAGDGLPTELAQALEGATVNVFKLRMKVRSEVTF